MLHRILLCSAPTRTVSQTMNNLMIRTDPTGEYREGSVLFFMIFPKTNFGPPGRRQLPANTIVAGSRVRSAWGQSKRWSGSTAGPSRVRRLGRREIWRLARQRSWPRIAAWKIEESAIHYSDHEDIRKSVGGVDVDLDGEGS